MNQGGEAQAVTAVRFGAGRKNKIKTTIVYAVKTPISKKVAEGVTLMLPRRPGSERLRPL